jgi:hypothetical protein
MTRVLWSPEVPPANGICGKGIRLGLAFMCESAGEAARDHQTSPPRSGQPEVRSAFKLLADSNARVRPHYARGRRGFRFLPCFFPCRHRVRLGHRDLASFLRAVTEACGPQRFREENAVVRFISLS